MADEDIDFTDMEKLHLSENDAERAATVDNIKALRKSAEEMVKDLKKISLPGRFFGWRKAYGVIDGGLLKVFSKPEDVKLDSTNQTIYVAGCQAALASEAKHGRPNCIEIAIAKPRSVVVFGCDSPADAEAWVNELNSVPAEGTQVISVDSLTEEQKAALEALKTKVEVEDGTADAVYIRFLRGNSWNVDQAAQYLNENKHWREKFNVQGMTINNVAKELKTGKLRLLDEPDKNGRPILVLQPAKHRPATSSPLDVAKTMVYNMEVAIKRMGDNVDTVVLIVDFKDISPKYVDLRVPKLIISTLQENYPCRIGQILIVNTPVFFRFVWATVRGFFSAALLDRVQILGEDMQTLQAFISPDCLLVEHGGTINFNVQSFLEARAKAEGVELVANTDSEAVLNAGIDQSLLASLKNMPAEEASEGAVKVGFLSKQGKIVTGWRRRYFILSPSGLLYYYKAEDSDLPQGVVLLERSTTSTDDSKPHGFCINTPLRIWKLAASSDEERDAWTKALDEVIERL